MRENVPMRVVAPPSVFGLPGVVAEGKHDREGLLTPLNMRERVLVSSIANVLKAFESAAPGNDLLKNERGSLLGLLVAFKDATGCAWVDAKW